MVVLFTALLKFLIFTVFYHHFRAHFSPIVSYGSREYGSLIFAHPPHAIFLHFNGKNLSRNFSFLREFTLLLGIA